jgi:type IV pilus assembly protein PilA
LPQGDTTGRRATRAAGFAPRAAKEIDVKKIETNNGFTLIELLIVVAIIGILAAVAIPQFASYRQKGYNSAATSDLKNAKTTFEAYFADNQYYPL